MAENKELSMDGICLITPENLNHFAPFLLPNARELMVSGTPVTAFGYVKDGIACGAIAGYLVEKSFIIISFYVAPEYRRYGVGSNLLTTLEDMVRPYTDVIYIDFYTTTDEHRLLPVLLEKYGYKGRPMPGRTTYATTVRELFEGKIFERHYGDDLLASFSDIDEKALKASEKEALKQKMPIPKGGFSAPSVDMECSTILIKNNSLKVYVAIEKTPDGSLVVSGVGNSMDTPMMLFKAIHDAVVKAVQRYPKDTPVLMQTVNEQSKKLFELLIDNAEPIDRHYELILAHTLPT